MAAVTTKMLPPAGCNKACYRDGTVGNMNPDGTIDVPMGHVAAMLDSGFTLAQEPATKLTASADATALTLCRDQCLPVGVFSIFKPGALMRMVCGAAEGTLVTV